MTETRTSRQAIKVARTGDGWSWTLVDEGAPAATGVASEQLAAMEAAWRTARSRARGPWTSYPEIVVESAGASPPRLGAEADR